MITPPDTQGLRRQRLNDPGDRLARWLRRLRWPVAALWLGMVVLLLPVANGLSDVTNQTPAAYLPASAPSTRVADLQAQALRTSGAPVSQSAIVAFAAPGGLSAGDLEAVDAAREGVAGRVGRVRGLGMPGPLQRSADGKAALFSVPVVSPQDDVDGVDTAAVDAIRACAASAAKGASPALEVAVTGAAAITADSGSTTLTALLLTALVIVAVILLLVYGSPTLWVLPLVVAIGAVEVARAAAHALAAAGLTVSFLSSAILIVLVFGAASDYALLLVHRYREELYRHRSCEEAMATALRRTLPTLAASAATVTGAMLCLLAAQSASLHGLGPIGAVAIFSALVAETTLLPALLLIVGRRAFWPRIPNPGAAHVEGSRVWSAIGGRIARQPATVAVGAIVLLAVACAGLATLRISNDPLNDLRGDPGSVVGERLLADHFPAGAIAPLVLLVPPQQAQAAARTARAATAITSITPGGAVGGYEDYTLILSVPPYSAGGSAAIAALREDLSHSAPNALVGGSPADEFDIAQAAGRDALVLIPLVLLVVLLVICVLLRAVVAPLMLVATTALSFAASFALSCLLWRYGFGYPGIDPQIPLYIFIFLVALGIDYNIFLSARIREVSRGLGTHPGTLRGLTVTGGVITAAGFILAATFAALAQLPSVSVTEVGTAVAIGVLIDTLLARTVLVPGLFLILGDRAWWPSSTAKLVGASRPAQTPFPPADESDRACGSR